MAPSADKAAPGRPDPGFGLKISPNVVLRNLLQQYPSGGQFFLEALQNADDTGRAGKFCALLDLRRHASKKLRPPQAGREVLQNEAIIFYDDAGFKERDWRSLQFMCDSEKRQSPHEAGAFGMGSRSFFHITDVLQVLSGTRLAALDPDDLLETGHFGEQVDFVEDRLLESFPDECAPFVGAFGCDMRSPFQGSLIRASLRAPARAGKCTFMPHAFDLARAKRIFTEFEETLHNGEVILFLNCVAKVELWRWDADAKDPSVIARVSLGVSSGHTLPRPMTGPREVKAFLERFETFAELEASLRSSSSKAEADRPPEILDIVEMETFVLSSGRIAKQKWLRCGRFFEDEETLGKVGACSCVPMVALAIPLQGEAISSGCLFASLPLPLQTGLPVHVNAHFRLHDNRRAIWRLTQDLDGEHKMWAEWNDRILTVLLPSVYASALELLASSPEGLSGADRGALAFPVADRIEREFSGLLEPLVQRLKALPLLPTPTGALAQPSQAVFFPTPTPALAACRAQLLRLCADAGHTVVDPPEHVVDLLHARGALERRPCTWAFWDVVLPKAASESPPEELVALLLALCEWAGSGWPEAEVRDLGERLARVAWVPTGGGKVSTVRGSFDPVAAKASGADSFEVVRQGAAQLEGPLQSQGLNADAVWRILHQCGMKVKLAWEDVADEADSLASSGDVARASKLLAHLNASHGSGLAGGRDPALERLRTCSWLPSTTPPASGAALEPPEAASQLRKLSEVFPTAEGCLVWAVAPALAGEIMVEGLKAGRSVQAEPTILVEQVRALAASPGVPRISSSTLDHLRAAFAALLPLLAKLPASLGAPSMLEGVAFVPCLLPEAEASTPAMAKNPKEPAAVLFRPSHAAFGASKSHRSLSPVVGVVLPEDQTVRLVAEAAQVTKEPRAEVLAEALRGGSDGQPPAELAVALVSELAARLRAAPPGSELRRAGAEGGSLPPLCVPTSAGGVAPVEGVFIDDAPWRQHRGDIVTLHAGVEPEDGRVLGCRSLRDRLANECEVDADCSGAQPLAEEAGDDPVGRVRQAMQGLGQGLAGGMLPLRLARHADAVGAQKVAFVFSEERFGTERLVDPRAGELQGPALYICLDRPLPKEDIEQMLRGSSPSPSSSSSAPPASSSAGGGGGCGGGFAGQGLAAMYRYCDCPQLLSKDSLHFFDISHGFVARPEIRRRSRRFSVDRLRQNFPDATAPFEGAVRQLLGEFPTVFRLALRSTRSELGLRVEANAVREELRRCGAAGAAEALLLFARHLRSMEFRDGASLLASATASVQDPEGRDTFFAALAARGPSAKHLSRLTITTAVQGEDGSAASSATPSDAEWAVQFCSGAAGSSTSEALEKAALEARDASQSAAAALIPFGAAAAKLRPLDEATRSGRVLISGLPTPIQSGSCCWLNGAFCANAASDGGGDVLPLAANEASPSAAQRWNRLLLQGPVAESVRLLAGHCTRLLLEQPPKSVAVAARHFALLPSGTERLPAMLAAAAVDPAWLLAEVVGPAAEKLQGVELSRLLLALLEWAAGSFKEPELRTLGEKLAGLKWVPTEGGVERAVSDTFDPAHSPSRFRVVRERRAALPKEAFEAQAGSGGDACSGAGARLLDAEAVWRALRLCGMKQELTWEDASAEAALIATEDKDLDRAGALLEHLNARHAALCGDRAAAAASLAKLAWAPATRPAPGAAGPPGEASQLLQPSGAFPPSALKLVWAVAPALTVEPIVEELRAGRTVEGEPEVLIQQVRALAEAAATSTTSAGAGAATVPQASAELLGHLQAAFAALLPLLSKLPDLSEHPALKGVAFIPCLSPGDDDGAALFRAEHAAFRAQHDFAALSPIVGVVKPTDPAIRMLAEAAGAQKAPRADVLAEALSREGPDAPSIDLAVALAVELAARLRAGEGGSARVKVPTVMGTVESASFVYIDDAPWQHKRKIVTLHPRISAEDARLLGCSSLRDEMARQCEDPAAEGEGDPFGQEADLVSQVRQLLLEYGESADLVAEFVQNSDDAGAREVAVFLSDESFGSERIVDPRAASLQGPALYICSDNPLTSEDIARMQCVGHSKKRLDFTSSGRFGVGLNVMYRYCDCPQLLANNCLHYFDLTRSYVAKPNGKRGRQFTVEKVQETFPDSFLPFGLKQIMGRFPTVFRLALRKDRTDLGLKMDFALVRSEMAKASQVAEKLLLFSRNLRRLEFHDGKTLDVVHQATIAEPEKYHGFFSAFPTSLLELKPGPLKHYLARKTITEKRPDGTTSTEWAIAHRVGVTDNAMLKVLQEQFDQPHGVALLPHGAAAVRTSPVELDARGGRICCGPPTPFRSGSCAWLQGSFALLSSRKALPLPEDGEDQPSLDKRWNKYLLEGPVAWSMRGLLQHCSELVTTKDFPLERYFAIFPIRGERLQTILARGTWKAAMNQAVFPVKRAADVTWVQGPTPTFFTDDLPDELQGNLVSDGLNLVQLPEAIRQEYEEALGRPRETLKAAELCDFLRDRFEKLHPGAAAAHEPESTSKPEGSADTGADGGVEGGLELEPKDTKMACLSDRDSINALLKFAVSGIWKAFCEGRPKEFYKFMPERLKGVPLLLTHAMEVTTFCARTKFSNWRDVLPEKKSLFLSRDTYDAIVKSVDTAAAGIDKVVETEIPGVRSFTLNDVTPYRVEVENAVSAFVGFMDPQNEALRVFWSLVAETFAEDHQIIGYDVFTAAQNVAWAKRERREALARGEDFPDLDNPATAPIGDRSWCKLIHDWHVLPICSKNGGGENGEDIVALDAAGMCVAPTLIDQDPKVVKSLTAILQEIGIDTIQHDIMSDNRISRLLRTICVTTNDDMLGLMIEHSNIENLTGVQKHDLLAYFAVLCVKGEKSEVQFRRVGELPLFKTASMDSTFTKLEEDTQYCCVDPSDPHANALSKLMPPKMVMLAWPTAQIKPIYEHLGIKLCNGEDAMVNLIIPRLPEICAEDDDGKRSGPFLMELHAYACIDRSPGVLRAAAMTAFVSSEDATRVGTPLEFTSPAGRCAREFRETLGEFLPVWWIQQNDKYMDMLHALGTLPVLSPAMILLCALELDTLAQAQASTPVNPETAVSVPELSEKLRRKSYELVEEFARAAEEVWPKKSSDQSSGQGVGPNKLLALPAPSAEENRRAMQSLLEASGLRILLARRHATETSMKQDATARNSRKPGLAEAGIRHADPELVAFRGVAFNSARAVLWTQSPLADHRAPPGTKSLPHMKLMLDRHSNGFFHIFGSFVSREHAPPELVMRHLGTLCGLMKTEQHLACVSTGSIMHEDLRAIWAHLSEHLTSPLSDDMSTTECMDAFDRLKALPCVAVTSEDVADRPADVLTLAPPRFSFFQLPLLKGKEATLKLYLRHVHAETTKEAQVFRTLGASDLPKAMDYAEASERVAAKAKELGRANWEWVVAALEACMRGVYEDLLQASKQGSDLSPKAVQNLHLFTSEGGIAPCRTLLWADEPRWQKRLERAAGLRFCALKDSAEQRDVAIILTQGAGLGQLTATVEERRVVDAAAQADTAGGGGRGGATTAEDFVHSVDRTVRSFEFARGLHAVLQHASEASERGHRHTLAVITQEMRKVKFKATSSRLRSGLFWKRGAGSVLEAVAAASASPTSAASPAPRVVKAEDGIKKEEEEDEKKDIKKEDEVKSEGVAEIKVESGEGEPKKADGSEHELKKAEAEGGAGAKRDASGQAKAPDNGKAPAPVPTSALAGTLVRGSEQDQVAYFDQAEKVIYIGDAAHRSSTGGGATADVFTAELAFAMRHAIPLLFDVEGLLLEALLRCAVRDGADGIQAFLEKRDIKLDTLAPRHLGPGDPLPEDLQEHLLWSMHATFGEGENAAVLLNDRFIIAEVSRWPDQKQAGDGLNRSYLMRISGDSFEPRKHFEVYKIHSRSSASTCTDLAIIPDEGVQDKEPGTEEDTAAAASSSGGSSGADGKASTADLKQLIEVKQYLREMARMSQEDYKAVMRRLFKTWHPDKVGDSPIANRIFNLLRMHEQWYKRRIAGESVGDDSWIDKEDLGEAEAAAKGKGKGESEQLALTGRTYVPAEGGQSSWFDEFEQEMRDAKAAREAGLKAKVHPRMPEAGEVEEPPPPPMHPTGGSRLGWTGPTRQSAHDGPTRMVDRQLSARFLQEAKVELICVRRLLMDVEGMRPVPPRAVFHCQQASEMAINSAMLRTCGLAEDEVAGGAAHDIIDFVKRIKTAEVNTEAQRRAQNVPISDEDVDWLKRAYLASRYPKPGRFGVPSVLYEMPDAQRALSLAEKFVDWAEKVEDLPDPSKMRRRWGQFEEAKTVTPSPGDPAAAPQVPSYVSPAQVPRYVPPPAGRGTPLVGPQPAPSPSSPSGGVAPGFPASPSGSGGPAASPSPPFSKASPGSPPPVLKATSKAAPSSPPVAKAPRLSEPPSQDAASGKRPAESAGLAPPGKRPRADEAAVPAGSSSPAADGDGGVAAAAGGGPGSGRRWARRLRKDG